jgi:hypothetical protein
MEARTAPLPQAPFLDTKAAGAGTAAPTAEPEGLDSPSEFALFAAATSSFGFLPSTFGLAVSPVDGQSGPPPAQPTAATAAPEKRPPSLSLRTDFFAPPVAAQRSHSQPPPASPSNLRLPGMPPRYGTHHGHRLSHAAPQQGHQYRRSHHQVPTTTHLAVQAPPATLNRGSRNSQTFPGAGTGAITTSTVPPRSRAPSTDAPIIAPASTPPPPPKLDDLLIAALLDNALAGDDDCPPDDEELPDYATSQAQAQASRRDEAARRAAELEAGWLRGRAERARGRPWRAWDRGSGV